jgi:2,3-bisphosphoglycerate-dependent phosphoglycerate mutase
VTTVLLIRHGRTAANTAGILVGRTSGVELDDVGVKQASDAAARLGAVPLRAIVTSPLRRCRQTAQALQAGRAESCPILVEKGLVECGYGEWTGRSLRDLSKDKLWHSVQQQPSAVRFPGGESMTEMSSRAVGAIRSWDRRMAADHGEDVIWAAVSHGDVIKAILADALGMHLDSFQRLMVDPASISVVRYTPVRPYVVTVNSAGGDLSGLRQERPKKPRGRRTKDQHDAPVGGGLGGQDVVD